MNQPVDDSQNPGFGQAQPGYPTGQQGYPADPGYGYGNTGYGHPGQPPQPGAAPGYPGQPQPGYPIQPPQPIGAVPTGASGWWLGLITLAGFLIFGNIFSTVALIVCYVHSKRWTPDARRNVRNSLNWQITFAILSVILLAAHIVLLFTLGKDPSYNGKYFPIGIPITLYALVGTYHVVMSIVNGVRAGKGRVVSMPGAIPFVRER